jgi:ABC-2 type transport system ATP-binding protein
MMEREEMSIVYSTHILDDLHRLADELVFLQDGRVRKQAAKDDLVDRWRRLLFRYDGEPSELDGVVQVRCIGDTFEVISSDGKSTEAALAEAGAKNVRIAALGLEEIAVNIMKGNGHV